jgi:hypothetical protein
MAPAFDLANLSDGDQEMVNGDCAQALPAD